MDKIFRVDSISLLHELFGYEKPKHPLITLIKLGKISTAINELRDTQFETGFYTISLKNNHGIVYGRRNVDFGEGSLMFMSPGQVIKVDYDRDRKDNEGWMLCFHPDLVRKSHLGIKMDEYTFFTYDISEALHLSQKERDIVTNIVTTIESEFSQNIDVYSHEIIISNIEVLLNYSKRFYGRQFITRSTDNKDVIRNFEILLKNYFSSDILSKNGLPSVGYLAKEIGYSANYLSDLLKKETGRNAQEHIQLYIIDKAKALLLGTSEPINNIAYMLGFEYPAHFSKFFKSKTGITPTDFRK